CTACCPTASSRDARHNARISGRRAAVETDGTAGRHARGDGSRLRWGGSVVSMPTYDRRRSEPYAELLDERATGRRSHRHNAEDTELAPFVWLAGRVA